MALLRQRRSRRAVCERLLITALVLVVHAVPASPCAAGEDLRMMEQSIKAGLLYNFLKYTEWPADHTRPAQSTVAVCIFGDDPFRGSLQPMADRSVNERRIVLRTLKEIEGAEACDLLFVNADEKGRWPQLAAFLAGKSVLTVSDINDFAGSGGMIEFGEKDDRIDVKINLVAVTAARMRVQDRLLKLARVVGVAAP